MNTATHIFRYIVAAILVAILGGLVGWYVFVHRQVATTSANDAARGFGSTQTFGSANGSTYQNTLANIGNGSSTVATGASGKQAPRLWEVTPSPVAGMGFVASSTRLDFVERATGNILEADPLLSKVTRVTNTLFPKVYEAKFTQSGRVMLRSINDSGAATTFLGIVATSSPEQINTPVALTGLYLTTNIRTVAVRNLTSQIFFLTPIGGGVSGVTTDWKNAAQKKIFASALTGWQAQWLDDGKVYITQNAGDDITGYAFRINSDGSMTSLLGAPGLVILPRSGSDALLYSTSSNGGVALYAKTSTSEAPVLLPISTVASKCVWSPWLELIAYCAVPDAIASRTFLHDWYAGIVHTKDSWWKVDVRTGTTERFFVPNTNTSLDVTEPVIDTGGGYIAFLNNLDRSLWMLKIDQ